MKICIAGGGTGGHLYTGIALAEAWTQASPGESPRLTPADIHFVGGTYGLEGSVLPTYPFPYTLLPARPVKGRTVLEKIKALVGLGVSYRKACAFLKKNRPGCVIGIGGYASVPLLLAAWRLGIPRSLIDQNAVPGVANRLLSRVADRVFVQFKEAQRFFPAGKTIQSGNPLPK